MEGIVWIMKYRDKAQTREHPKIVKCVPLQFKTKLEAGYFFSPPPLMILKSIINIKEKV